MAQKFPFRRSFADIVDVIPGASPTLSLGLGQWQSVPHRPLCLSIPVVAIPGTAFPCSSFVALYPVSQKPKN